ncbi:keratin, type I cytoskeletal 9-like [Macrosteles quadrilineatus]|uniref:keratin, type I cytoskeletal 9-like n=1 Tax=Macrosteles quadrilineatus TaxID=74068 RepID=UPI0023E25F0E|nr:keratin, type I cytoskeletal 9-like [Macrosteles quadrilineatus]
MVQGRERVLLLVAVSAVVTVAVAAVPRQDTAQDVADPWDGVYNDCLSTWSLPCIQRKLLVFIDRIGRVKKLNLVGDAVTMVRVGGDPGPPITEDGLQARLLPGQESEVGALLQHSFFSFLSNHVLRFSLPDGLSVTSGGRALGDSFEINLGRAYEEARGKKKKQMMMMGAMMMAKAAMLGKMMMLIIKFKAIKALLLSIVALALAKIQLFKSLKNSGGGKGGGKETYIIIKAGKGGGGHGSPPSGGGGWSDSSGGSGGGGGGWSSGGGGGGWQADSGGGGGWSSGGGGGGGGGGGWSSGGGGGGGGGSSGWSGGGGGSGGWGRNYDASWLAYRAHAQNKTDT